MGERDSGVDVSKLEGVQRHLEGLKKTSDGAVLYSLIERGLQKYGNEGQMGHALAAFLNPLLERYVQDTNADPATRFKAKLVQQSLAPHLPPRATAKPQAPAPAGDDDNDITFKAMPEPRLLLRNPPPAANAPEATMDRIPTTLAQEVLTAIFAQQNPGLTADDDAVSRPDVEAAEEEAAGEAGQGVVAEEDPLRVEYLRFVEENRVQLQKRLQEIRRSGFVDNLTGLPNRSALVRRLESEIQRAQRDHAPLSLALVAVDGLDALIEQHGAEFAENVLSYYATEMLSQFRSYDIVARHGQGSFAVIFPNTPEPGALRALDKITRRVEVGFIVQRGRRMPVPAFSSVVMQHAKDESGAEFLARADGVLTGSPENGAGEGLSRLPA